MDVGRYRTSEDIGRRIFEWVKDSRLQVEKYFSTASSEGLGLGKGLALAHSCNKYITEQIPSRFAGYTQGSINDCILNYSY